MTLRALCLAIRALPKSVVFNLKYFALKDAIRLPVLVSHQVWLKRAEGTVVLDVPSEQLKPGLVKIGFGDVGIFDRRYSRTVWDVSGKVVFRGRTLIGHGSKVSVSGTLILGGDFTITAESAIVCRKEIRIGAGCLVSWDVLIIDSDFHKIYDESDERLNDDARIQIGDRVWIGCRALILKGVTLGNGCVVAANTTLTKPVLGDGSLIAGNPARIVREDITWIA